MWTALCRGLSPVIKFNQWTNLPAACSLISSENDTYWMSGGSGGGGGIGIAWFMTEHLNSYTVLNLWTSLSSVSLSVRYPHRGKQLRSHTPVRS